MLFYSKIQCLMCALSLILGLIFNIGNDLDATATDSTVQQLLAKQILPTIKSTTIENLYDGDLGDTNVDGILISHPHRDHYGGLPFLNRQIPVYAGFASKKIILALAASEGQNASNDFDDLNWHEFRTGEILDIKGLVIVPVHVDHSVPRSLRLYHSFFFWHYCLYGRFSLSRTHETVHHRFSHRNPNTCNFSRKNRNLAHP